MRMDLVSTSKSRLLVPPFHLECSRPRRADGSIANSS
jgi:hypothetical protein